MKRKLLVLGCVALVLLGLGLYLAMGSGGLDRTDRAFEARLDAAIAPVTKALDQGQAVDQAMVAALAHRLDTRWHLYEALEDSQRLDLFPPALAAEPRLAESEMATWLLHPHELGALPTEMTLTATLTRQVPGTSRQGTFYVFRFRVDPPHWAAGHGQMAGVSGPWPADGPMLTWSELAPYDSATPDQHLDALLAEARS